MKVALALAAVNLYFAYRSIAVGIRSHARLKPPRHDLVLPLLSIIVPARNEERQIETCVRSLLAQTYPQFEVVVVDDRSDDRTREILRAIERDDERLRVVDGAELPPGWVGKPWALAQGAAIAHGAWLLFTDADTVHETSASAGAMRTALGGGYDVLSVLTQQIMRSAGERIALPSMLWTIALGIGALDDVNDARKRDVAIFNGQYILFRRDAYDAIGGHGAVRAEIAEDLELAKLLKRDGHYRTYLAVGDGRVRTRMYRSFRELWSGFVKNFALGVRGRPWLAAAAVVFFALLSPVTPAAAIYYAMTRQYTECAIVTGSMVIAAACAGMGMQRLRLGAGSAVWLPVGMAVMLGIFITSLVKHARGGVTWRGRRY